jgi:O-antigen ligase
MSRNSYFSTPLSADVNRRKRSTGISRIATLFSWMSLTLASTGYLYLTGLLGSFSQIYLGVIVISSTVLLFRLVHTLNRVAYMSVLFLFVLSLIPGVANMGASDYSQSKIVGMMIAVLLMVIPSSVPDPERAILFTLVCAALFCFILTLEILVSGRVLSNNQIGSDLLNSVHAGRAIGLAVVVFAVFFLSTRAGLRWKLASGVLALIGVYGLVAVGSRGPALAAAAAIGTTFVLVLIKQRHSRVWITLGAAAGLLLVIGVLTSRSSRLLSDDGNGRNDIYRAAQESLFKNPFGVGWGNFERVPGATLQWPHNIFLEIGVEGGWLPLVAFVILVIACVYGSWRRALADNGSVGLYVWSFLVFALVNAQFSADITANGIVWAAIGFVLATTKKAPQNAA